MIDFVMLVNNLGTDDRPSGTQVKRYQ